MNMKTYRLDEDELYRLVEAVSMAIDDMIGDRAPVYAAVVRLLAFIAAGEEGRA